MGVTPDTKERLRWRAASSSILNGLPLYDSNNFKNQEKQTKLLLCLHQHHRKLLTHSYRWLGHRKSMARTQK